MPNTYDFTQLHTLISSNISQSNYTHSSHPMSSEEFSSWREKMLSLDIPKTVSRITDKLDKLPAEGLHLFFENGTIKNSRDWYRARKEVKWISPVYLDCVCSDIDVSDWYKKLARYEKGKIGKQGKNTIIFNTFKIMLPSEFEISQNSLSKFAAFIMKRVGYIKETSEVLPYFYAFSKTGHSRYLWIFTSERFYFPESKEVEFRYSHDIYKNESFQICARNAEGARLFARAGTVYRKESVFFSDKTRQFSFAGRKAIQGFLHTFKAAMLEFFKSHHLTGSRTLMLPRLNYRKYRRHSRKYNVLFLLNAYFIELEKSGSYLLDGMYALDLTKELNSVYGAFKKARRGLASSMKGTYQEYGKPWHYEFNALMDSELMCYIMDINAVTYLNSMDKIHDSVFGVIE